jgi:hypothetical protein
MLLIYAMVVTDSNLGKETVRTWGFHDFSHTFHRSLRSIPLALNCIVYRSPCQSILYNLRFWEGS